MEVCVFVFNVFALMCDRECACVCLCKERVSVYWYLVQ